MAIRPLDGRTHFARSFERFGGKAKIVRSISPHPANIFLKCAEFTFFSVSTTVWPKFERGIFDDPGLGDTPGRR